VFRRRAEKLMVLTVPDITINDGPGYRMSYGEATKRAPESSVLNAANAPARPDGAGSHTRSELVGREVPNW
jgi:hypothetical protein